MYCLAVTRDNVWVTLFTHMKHLRDKHQGQGAWTGNRTPRQLIKGKLHSIQISQKEVQQQYESDRHL